VFIGALATAIEHEAVRHAMVLGAGESVAFEMTIPQKAAVAGRAVSELATSPEFPLSCVFAGMIEPSGEFQAPRGASVVSAGMVVLLVARRRDLGKVIEFFMRIAT
jgi:trk system potassium uptake protein TrkA